MGVFFYFFFICSGAPLESALEESEGTLVAEEPNSNRIEFEGKTISLIEIARAALTSMKKRNETIPTIEILTPAKEGLKLLKTFKAQIEDPEDGVIVAATSDFPGAGMVGGKILPWAQVDEKLKNYAIQIYGMEAEQVLKNSKIISFQAIGLVGNEERDLDGFVFDYRDLRDFEVEIGIEELDSLLTKNEIGDLKKVLVRFNSWDQFRKAMNLEIWGTDLPIFMREPDETPGRNSLYYSWALAEEISHAIDGGMLGYKKNILQEKALAQAYGEKNLEDTPIETLASDWKFSLPYFLNEGEIRAKWFAAQYLKNRLGATFEQVMQIFYPSVAREDASDNASAIPPLIPIIIHNYYSELYNSKEPPVWMNPYWKRIAEGKPLYIERGPAFH